MKDLISMRASHRLLGCLFGIRKLLQELWLVHMVLEQVVHLDSEVMSFAVRYAICVAKHRLIRSVKAVCIG